MKKGRARPASDKYKTIFGDISSLSEQVPQSTGVSNMLEWLTWSTSDVLGITKTQYRNLVFKLSDDPLIRNVTVDEKTAFVKAKLDELIRISEKDKRYEKPQESKVFF